MKMRNNRRSSNRRKAAIARSAERARKRQERAGLSHSRQALQVNPVPPPQFEPAQSPLHFKILPRPGDRIWLFTWLLETDPARRKELIALIRRNGKDPRLKGVVVLTPGTDLDLEEGNGRLRLHFVENQVTFRELRAAMETVCEAGDQIIWGQPGSWFDESLSLLYKLDLDQRLLTLNAHPEESTLVIPEVWVSSWPLPLSINEKFRIDIPNAARLIANAFLQEGYAISNPSFLLKVHAPAAHRPVPASASLFVPPDHGAGLGYKNRTRPAGTALHSISTLVTEPLAGELLVLVKSLRLAGIDLPLFVLTDSATARIILDRLPDPNIQVITGLDVYTGKSREEMVKMRIWDQFMLEKTRVIQAALEQFPDTLFVDCDLVFLHPLPPLAWEGRSVALSPHHIIKRDEIRFGRFNAGYLAVRDTAFLDWWGKATHEISGYHEQECLTHAHKYFPVAEIPVQQNFGWWRLDQSGEREARLARFTAGNEGIFYDQKPLISVHTHILSRDPRFEGFNHLILQLLSASGLPRHRELATWIHQLRESGK